MKKKNILAIMLAAVLGLSGCSGLGKGTSGNAQSETPEEQASQGAASETQHAQDVDAATEQNVEIDTEDGMPFIETEDLMEGTEPEDMTEEDAFEEDFMIVPDTESEQEMSGAETEAETSGEPVQTILTEVIGEREALGEHWSVGYEDLATGEKSGYHETDVMQSASVVKLFIMGAVYRYMCYPSEGEEPISFGESYDGELRDTIEKMITVSDNDAANLLIDRLGEGDFTKGAALIKTFCEENGYTGTSIGRRFLESNPSGDNYTTAADTRKFLSDLYHGTLVNEEASEKMLSFVKAQTRKNKIPAGLPEGFTSGNKTGEMPEGYGLGCIENDVAIIFPPEGQGEGYILTVLSNDLGGRNDEAIAAIGQISSLTASWYLQN